MTDLVEKWRDMPKLELAAQDIGTLWNAIDDLVDEIEQLRETIKQAELRARYAEACRWRDWDEADAVVAEGLDL